MTDKKKKKRSKTKPSLVKSVPVSAPSGGKSDVTQEEFDEALVVLLDDMSGTEILATPGAYEVFSEALNNEAIDLAKKFNEDRDDKDA